MKLASASENVERRRHVRHHHCAAYPYTQLQVMYIARGLNCTTARSIFFLIVSELSDRKNFAAPNEISREEVHVLGIQKYR